MKEYGEMLEASLQFLRSILDLLFVYSQLLGVSSHIEHI